MILPVISFNNRNTFLYSAPSFQAKKAVPVKEIKNLHALTCPRCGGPIIEPQKLIEAYRVISLPLKTMIEKGFMDKSKKFPELWTLLNHFSEQYPTRSLDKILESTENHTFFRRIVEKIVKPDIDIYDREQYDAVAKDIDSRENGIRKAARKELRSASVVMGRLKSFLPILKEIEKYEPYKYEIRGKIGAFEELLYYSEMYPHKTLSQIINTPEVSEHILTMKEGLNKEFIHKSRIVMNEVRELIKGSTKYPKENLNEFQKKFIPLLYNSSVKDSAKRISNTLEYCKRYTIENDCQKIYPKLADLVKQMPEPSFNAYVELSNYIGKKDDYLIVDSLIKPFVGSIEHFVPRSAGGVNYLYNKVAMHRGCNTKRSSIPYEEYIQLYPKLPYNMEQQLKQVVDSISKKRIISVYDLYPFMVAETLRKESKGAINPNLLSYCKKLLKQSSAKVEAFNQELKDLSSERDRLIHTIITNQDTDGTARAELEKINETFREVKAQRREECQTNGSLKRYLSEETK